MKKISVAILACALSVQAISIPAFADNEDNGTIIGGIVGGVLGNTLGRGVGGKIFGTVFGAVVGSVLGGAIGSQLDENDREELAHAQQECLNGDVNRTYRWKGRESEARGEFVCVQGYHRRTKTVCREYKSVVYYRGEREVTKGYACRTKGTWTEATVEDVDFTVREERMPLPAPVSNPDLHGYCADESHEQFYAAKQFAMNDLRLDESASVRWASEYNETHNCGTLSVYSVRFMNLLSLAKNTLGMNNSEAYCYAVSRADRTTKAAIGSLKDSYMREYRFAREGMNMNASAARNYALKKSNNAASCAAAQQ